jgi:hypothetical protein
MDGRTLVASRDRVLVGANHGFRVVLRKPGPLAYTGLR